MRLKTQSHLITIAVTGLVVWQVAQATHSEPVAPPPASAVEELEAEPEAEPEAEELVASGSGYSQT